MGIGINVGAAPDIPDDGPQRGRPSAWLADCGVDASQGLVQGLGKAITVALGSWVAPGKETCGPTQEAALISEWSRRVDWSTELTLRDEPGTRFLPVRLEPDGQLRVRDLNGLERLLLAEYLF